MAKSKKIHITSALLGRTEQKVSNWDEVRRLIEQLNGDNQTDLFLGDASSDYFMSISGGNDNRYVITVREGKDQYFDLIDPTKGDDPVMVMTSEMVDYYPANRVHDLLTLLAVAKWYSTTGTRTQTCTWKKGP